VNDIQRTTVDFPIVADLDKKVAQLYEMIHPNESSTEAVRSVFIIPPNVSSGEAKKKFPQGWREIRSYLRLTKVA
jgi:alkyl hydroperoxide reductase subunit AhpC